MDKNYPGTRLKQRDRSRSSLLLSEYLYRLDTVLYWNGIDVRLHSLLGSILRKRQIMTIQKVTRAKPQTEEVPSGLVGYIVVRKGFSVQSMPPQWDVVDSPFKDAPIHSSFEDALKRAEDGEFIIQIDLPLVGKG